MFWTYPSSRAQGKDCLRILWRTGKGTQRHYWIQCTRSGHSGTRTVRLDSSLLPRKLGHRSTNQDEGQSLRPQSVRAQIRDVVFVRAFLDQESIPAPVRIRGRRVVVEATHHRGKALEAPGNRNLAAAQPRALSVGHSPEALEILAVGQAASGVVHAFVSHYVPIRVAADDEKLILGVRERVGSFETERWPDG